MKFLLIHEGEKEYYINPRYITAIKRGVSENKEKIKIWLCDDMIFEPNENFDQLIIRSIFLEG